MQPRFIMRMPKTRSSIRNSQSSMPCKKAFMWETISLQSVPSFRSAGTSTSTKREWESRKKTFPRFWKIASVEVDVPALLNEGTDCNEIVSHINAFLQGIELCEFLIELRAFGIRIMKRG